MFHAAVFSVCQIPFMSGFPSAVRRMAEVCAAAGIEASQSTDASPAALTMYRTIVLILAPCYRPAEFPFPGKGGEKRRFPQVRRRVHTLRPSPQIQSGQRSHTDLTWRRCAATWILAGLYAMLR